MIAAGKIAAGRWMPEGRSLLNSAMAMPIAKMRPIVGRVNDTWPTTKRTRSRPGSAGTLGRAVIAENLRFLARQDLAWLRQVGARFLNFALSQSWNCNANRPGIGQTKG